MTVTSIDMTSYPSPDSVMDVNDHPDMNLPDPGYQPRMQHSTKMAGDVIPLRGEDSMGSGGTLKATGYYYGTKSNPKVQSILPKLNK